MKTERERNNYTHIAKFTEAMEVGRMTNIKRLIIEYNIWDIQEHNHQR